MWRILRVEHLVPVAAAAIFLTAVRTRPQLAFGLEFGALLAPAVMVYLHRWATFWATVACALIWLAADRFGGSGLGALVVLPWGYAAAAWFVAGYRPDQVEQASPRRTVPAPAALPPIGVPPAVLAVAILAGAVALGLVRSDAYAAIAAGTGVALLARTARRRRQLRALFGRPQPVRPVRVVDDYGYVHVLVPEGDGRTAVEFGITVDEADPPSAADPDTGPRTRPALLYGEPRTGHWCAVEVGGRVRVPMAPVGEIVEVPYDAEHHLPREVAEDEEQVVDPEQLIAADRDAGPEQVREHRVAPVRRWFEAVAIGLGSAAAAGQIIHLIGRWHGWPAITAVAVVAGVAYEFGWRTQLRPRLRWDVGGLVAITFRGRERAMWTLDSGIVHDDDGSVIVTTGDVVLVVDAPRPWPSWVAQRTADQLVAGLRDARRQALDGPHTPAPPDLPTPHRPVLLYLVWAGTVLAVAALFGW
jgi:hypothetical protein